MGAINYLNPIDLNTLELYNFRVHNTGTSGVTALGGRLIYDSGALKFGNGTGWVTLRDSATSIVSGDITSLAWSKITGVPNLVNTFGGKTGAITLKGNNTAIGTVNLSIDDSKVLSAALVSNSSWASTVTAGDARAISSVTVNSYGLVTAVGSSDFYWANVKISKSSSKTTAPVFGSVKIGGDDGVTLSFVDGKLKIDRDVYSTGQVSAFGEGESGGASGGAVGGLLTRWTDGHTDTDALSAVLGVELNSRLSTLESNGALTFTTTGNGNAVTGVEKNGTGVTVTKGLTFVQTSDLFDSSSKILTSRLPDFILGQLVFGGTVNANGVATLSTNAKTKLGVTSNTITLENVATSTTSGKIGWIRCEGLYFLMSANSSFASLPLQTGDWLISTGTQWGKIDNTDAVTGVKGNSETNYRTGNVNITKANIGLGNVENTALSTWAGSANITTLGTVSTGTWQGTKIADSYISSAATWNAKQNAITSSSKLSWTLISSTPTTIGGYGITDAKIANGVITLGSNTITPLTASSTLDATKLSGTIPPECYTDTTYSAAANGGLSLSGTAFSIASATMTRITNGDTAYGAFGHSYPISGSTLTTYTTTTNFTTGNLVATLYDSSNNVVMADMKIESSTVGSKTVYNVKVTFAAAIGRNTYRLVVIGI